MAISRLDRGLSSMARAVGNDRGNPRRARRYIAIWAIYGAVGLSIRSKAIRGAGLFRKEPRAKGAPHGSIGSVEASQGLQGLYSGATGFAIDRYMKVWALSVSTSLFGQYVRRNIQLEARPALHWLLSGACARRPALFRGPWLEYW